MVYEFSAGGIVFKKQLTNDQRPTTNDLLWLVCQHSQHKGWVFPKGLIGDTRENESKEDTAVREVKEETGIDAEIIDDAHSTVSYFYTWKGGKRKKTVYYYLMKHLGGDIEEHDHEMMAVDWWPEERVKKDLTYRADKKAFEEALKVYKKQQAVSSK